MKITKNGGSKTVKLLRNSIAVNQLNCFSTSRPNPLGPNWIAYISHSNTGITSQSDVYAGGTSVVQTNIDLPSILCVRANALK